tara:strand:+ start:2847 stop:3116 length:270 start_codon:yes stop_codon:yes gene_type:complete
MKKKRTKPTIKDVAQTVIRMQQVQSEMIDWIKNIQLRVELVDNTLGAYLGMKKDGPKLEKWIDKEVKKKKKKEDSYISPNDPGDENDAS